MVGLGRYNLLLQIGKGGMGAVYLARQKNLRRFCAIKLIQPQLASDQETAERFLKEARATANLSHPNLVGVFDCDQFEGMYFIAMEYVEGMSVAEAIRRKGPLPLPLAVNWVHQALVGLDYLHSKDVVHRDIKPDNMIVDSHGVLRIMDLGLAKDHFEGDQSMTTTGTMMGSPHYMSPEQINDSKQVDSRTDIYSLGISFFQMLTGRLPYPASSAAAICVAHLQEPMPSVQFPDAELTQAIDGIIARMVEKDRHLRFQSAAELSQALEPWATTYTLDSTCQEYLTQLPFKDRRVESLLEKEGISLSEVDADLDSVTPSPTGEFSLNPKSPSLVASSVARFPAASICSPSQTDHQNGVSHSGFWKWAGWGLATAATVLLLGGILRTQKREVDAIPLPAAQPVTSTQSIPLTPEPKLGGLLVTTIPSDAVIMFRGDSQSSPATFNKVPIGTYKVQISKQGYWDEEAQVEIKEGRHAQLSRNLTPKETVITVKPNLAIAEIIVNDKSYGKGTVDVKGSYNDHKQCVVRAEGFEPQVLTLHFGEKDQEIFVSLRPQQNRFQGMHQNMDRRSTFHDKPDESEEPPFESNQETESHPRRSKERLVQMREKIGESFDLARQASDGDWPSARDQIIEKFKAKMKEEKVGTEEQIELASRTLGYGLNKIRKMADWQYEKEREQKINMMMMEIGNQFRPGGKGGPWGGKRPPMYGQGPSETPPFEEGGEP